MKILTATYVDGRLDIPEGSLHEGDTVTLLIPEAEKGFTLSSEDQAFLAESIAQTQRGEVGCCQCRAPDSRDR